MINPKNPYAMKTPQSAQMFSSSYKRYKKITDSVKALLHEAMVVIPGEAARLHRDYYRLVSNHKELLTRKPGIYSILLLLIPISALVFDMIIMQDPYKRFVQITFGEYPALQTLMGFMLPVFLITLYMGGGAAMALDETPATSTENEENVITFFDPFEETKSTTKILRWLQNIIRRIPRYLGVFLKYAVIYLIPGFLLFILLARYYSITDNVDLAVNMSLIYLVFVAHLVLAVFGKRISKELNYLYIKHKYDKLRKKKDILERRFDNLLLTIDTEALQWNDMREFYMENIPEYRPYFERIPFSQPQRRFLQTFTALDFGVAPIQRRELLPLWNKPPMETGETLTPSLNNAMENDETRPVRQNIDAVQLDTETENNTDLHMENQAVNTNLDETEIDHAGNDDDNDDEDDDQFGVEINNTEKFL